MKTKLDRDNEMLAAIDARNCVESVTGGDLQVMSFEDHLYEDQESSEAKEIFKKELAVAFEHKVRERRLQQLKSFAKKFNQGSIQ